MIKLARASLYLTLLSAFADSALSESPVKPGFFNVILEVGGSTSAYKPTLDGNWQTHFLPAGGSMKISSLPMSFSLGLKPEVVLSLGRVRIPVSYQLFEANIYGRSFRPYIAKQGIRVSSLGWWDRVTAADVVAEHYTPRVGVEIKAGKYIFVPSAQHYELLARKFNGVDCHNCVNTSKVYSKAILEKGVSPRLDISKIGANEGVLNNVGYYFECLGLKTFRFGIVLKWKVR
jgi:hypothetical protein